MPNLLSHLDKSNQRQLLDDLNYLNLAEIRGFCRRHSIPTRIMIETGKGELRASKDTDRKSVVLARVRAYLRTGRIPPATCFAAKVVRLTGLPDRPLRSNDRLYYGCYGKKNKAMLELLRRLTGGKFRNGAVARILCREFWTNGEAPTFAAFAKAWLKAADRGLGIDEGKHPEAAFLTDRAMNEAGADWKSKRASIARRTIKELDKI